MSHAKEGCGHLEHSPSGMRSTFERIIAFGYYDGPTDGILRCRICDRELYFDRIAERSGGPDDDVVRIFELSPIPDGSLTRFVEAMSAYQQPGRPHWAPLWEFPGEADRERMEAVVARIIDQKGPVECLLASSSWLGEILGARTVTPDELGGDRDWFAELGLVETAIRE